MVNLNAPGTTAATDANFTGDDQSLGVAVSPDEWYEMSPAVFREIAANATLAEGTAAPGTSDKVEGRPQLYVQTSPLNIWFHSGTLADDWLNLTATAVADDLYAGWSSDTAVLAAEVLLGVGANADTLTLPTDTGSQYLWVWRSDTDGGDPAEVHIAGAGNSRNTFGPAAALTVDSTAGQLIVSVQTLNAGLLGGESLRVV